VSRDASLTDFAEEGGAGNDEPAAAATEVGDTGADPATETGDVAEHDASESDPSRPSVTPTVEWSARGRPCETCGEPARQRWEQAGEFVCGECKEW
jgi:hypothetical protein